MSKVTFGSQQRDFSSTLRKKVDEYFSTTGQKYTGTKKLYIKSAILFGSAITLYIIAVFGGLPLWVGALCAVLLGFNTAAIGFNMMHDGAHGSYSQSPWVNNMMARTLDLLGGSSYMWKVKHNVNHHNYTNIEGMDSDIDNEPWFRTSTNQPFKWYHRFQHIYCHILYCFTYLSWVYLDDIKRYFTRNVVSTKMKKMKLKDHLLFWGGKITYLTIFLAIPMIVLGVGTTLVGYVIMTVTCGFILSVVFQLAHVVEEAEFPTLVTENGKAKVENDWTVHQLATTVNFSTKDPIVTWFVGGLNFQVEHHLFPAISHIHYPQINKIVKDVCNEYGVPYHEYPTMWQAFKSHVSHLKKVGLSKEGVVKTSIAA